MIESKVLNEKQAAIYIGMSVSFLRKSRSTGILPGHTPGPRWVKIGRRVSYLKDDLDAWINKHLMSPAEGEYFC